MITVIVAGGQGSRLWPLSTPNYPKHLLKLTGDRSLLQSTYDRARKVSEKIYVITEASHADHVREQLPDLRDENIIVEPGRRGTALCFVAALERIAQHDHDGESIVFMHADHQIRDTDGFINTVQYAGKAAKVEKKIVLLGLEPTYPATGLGYIHKGQPINHEDEAFVYTVQSFKEKPTFDVAQQYVHSGEYLWNMGYFVAPLEVFLDMMKRFAPEMSQQYEALQKVSDDPQKYSETYLSFDNIAIDYALLEKTPDLLVTPGTFDWVDVGSFADLHGSVDLDQAGNHSMGENIELIDVENSYIRNDETDKPVAVIGLDNVVVVNTPHGVLVVRKDLAQKVGDVAKKLQAKTTS